MIPLNSQTYDRKTAVFRYASARMRSGAYTSQQLLTDGSKPLQNYTYGGALVGDLVYELPALAASAQYYRIQFNARSHLSFQNTVVGTPQQFVPCQLTQWGIVAQTGNSFLEIDGVRAVPVYSNPDAIIERNAGIQSIRFSELSAEVSADPDWALTYANYAGTAVNYLFLFIECEVFVKL